MKIHSLFFSLLLGATAIGNSLAQSKVVPLEVTLTSLNYLRTAEHQEPEELNVTLHKGEQLLIKPQTESQLSDFGRPENPAEKYSPTHMYEHSEYINKSFWFSDASFKDEHGTWVYYCADNPGPGIMRGIIKPIYENVVCANEQGELLKWKSYSQHGIRFEAMETGTADLVFSVENEVPLPQQLCKSLRLAPVIHVNVIDGSSD